ncbi:MAG: 2-hydroxyacyl-CoA dehydratase [Deltaproteobacteria bacterium]|nr:2-hydroxyacyl-CoA dehydratase [Deltaproteobacteria bacterium]
MIEFLKMCAYEEKEIDSERPRVQKAFDRLGITSEDIGNAMERLAMYYDMELLGVRKIFGIYLRDLVNVVLIKDEGRKKIIHTCMAPGSEILGSAIMSYSDDIGLINPNFTFMVIMGCVFGKFVPILQAAEKQWLRRGIVSHCGMVKTRLGILSLNLIPRPDLTVTTGFTCETSPKTNELIQELYGIPAYYIDTCQDREAGEYPAAGRATDLAAKSMRKLGRSIMEQTGFEITDDMLWETLDKRSLFGQAMDKVIGLIRKSDPLPFKSTHLNILNVLPAIPFKKSELSDAVDALNILHSELLERTRKGIGATKKGAPRVMVVLPNHHSDPRLEYLANQTGIAIVASDFEFSSGQDTSGAGVRNPNDPYDVIVQHLHGSLAQPLYGRISIIIKACKELNINGVLNHYHVGCRYVAGDAMTIKSAVMKGLGIPVLTLEWENFDPRVYNHEEYKSKLETFKLMMKAAN